jgi:hypothetical protein
MLNYNANLKDQSSSHGGMLHPSLLQHSSLSVFIGMAKLAFGTESDEPRSREVREGKDFRMF